MQQLLKTLCFIFIFLPISICASDEFDTKQKISQQIVNELFAITNNKRINFAPPRVVIKDEKKVVAAYFPMKNEIVLETAAYAICQNFGSDSLNALAFILGHELTHSFQLEIIKNKQETNYMAYHNHYDDGFELEKGADIAGAFSAYLAGYKISGIVSDLIESIYSEYELNDNLTGYPPKNERLLTANEVEDILEDLIDLFDASSYLMAMGEYQYAGACYEKILEYYSGAEIYNNLGVCFALYAMEFTNSDVDLYLFPFQVDQNSRMKKPKKGRGNEGLNPIDQYTRNQYLNKSLKYLKEATSFDQTYFEADINILSVLILLEKYNNALEHYQNKGMNFRGEVANSEIYNQRAKLALAIAYANLKNQKAASLFENLVNSNYPIISYMAKYNEKIFLEGKCGAAEDHSCIDIKVQEKVVDGVYLHRQMLKGTNIILNKEDHLMVYIDKKDNSTVFKFTKDDILNLSMQLVKVRQNINIQDKFTQDKKIQLLNTSQGSYIICKEDKVVYSLDNNSIRLMEWAKFSNH